MKLKTLADFSSEKLGSPFKNNLKIPGNLLRNLKNPRSLSLRKSGNPVYFSLEVGIDVVFG